MYNCDHLTRRELYSPNKEKKQKQITISRYSEPQRGEESLICHEDFIQEKGFFTI